MKPQLVQAETLEAKAGETLDRAAAEARAGAGRLEHLAGEDVDRAMTAARDPRTRSRFAALDTMLKAVGAELCLLAIIALALVILCAPIGLGVAAIWFAGLWAAKLTGSRVLGWVAGILVFLFLCRYVWGAKLQRACRRAALALIAGMSG